jgi:Ca2+-binding RTX toxin-like protein
MKTKNYFKFLKQPFNGRSVGPDHVLYALPADPIFSSDAQWHLGFIGSLSYATQHSARTTAGFDRVWHDFQGDGLSVGIWDNGVQQNHWDLFANYDANKHVSVNGTVNNGQNLTQSAGHGTAVAGLIAADDNLRGGLGIAHDAQITSIRIFGGVDDINRNWSRYLLTLDGLGSFDVTNHSYGGFPDFERLTDVSKFGAASMSGRSGLGTVNVKAAGNNNVDGNGELLDASRFTITVGAISDTLTANIAAYSNYGAHMLVSAPAASVSTDLTGVGAGYDGLLSGDYTNVFGGTSAAGPVVAGVVALMLSANAKLGWRDIQNILAYSAVGVGSLYSKVSTSENFAWKWNGAANWNGGGLHFSEDYGYGMVNAFNAVRMAEVWTWINPESAVSSNEAVVSTGVMSVNKKISDVSTLTHQFNVTSQVLLEHVALTVSLTHTFFTDLRIRLISPDGTVMTLYDGSTGDSQTSDGTFTYTFGADGFRGESSAGLWTLQIQDAARLNTGTLKSVTMVGYGAQSSVNSVYHYTSEVLMALSASGRPNARLLTDLDGGIDWVNASAISAHLVLDLNGGMSSTMGGQVFLTIASGTLIENAIGGDGNDTIMGNHANNLIYGMRGDDMLLGGDGFDVAGFTGTFAEYEISALDGVTTVHGPDGQDMLSGFERLRFKDMEVNDPSLGVSPPDNTAPTLISTTPSDNAIAVRVDSQWVLTFSEMVQAGHGSAAIYAANGVLHEMFDADDLIFMDKTVTINPTVDLSKDAAYYLRMDSGAVTDLAGNAFPGIEASTELNITTESVLKIISGSSRNDVLNGTSGSDQMNGLSGNDSLNGKLGNDVLTGGPGKDAFVFDTPLSVNNIDTITDFNVRDDTIRLENAIFSKLSKTGTLNRNFFRANDDVAAQDSNDHILLDTRSGVLYYDADGAGGIQAQPFAVLVGWIGTLTSSDFVVI